MLLRGVQLAPVVALLLWIDPARAGGEGAPGFSREELGRLERGELVTRPTTERNAEQVPLVGGSSWQVIDRPADEVWAVLLDPAQYPSTLPQVTRASVVRDEGSERTVLIEHGNRFLQLSYYLDVRIDAGARRIGFRIDETRPKDVRSGTGFYLVRTYGKGRCLLAYGVLADIGDRFFVDLMRSNVQEWILKVPWMIKRVVEKRPPVNRAL